MKLTRLLIAAAVALPACAVMTSSASGDTWLDGSVKVSMPSAVTVKGDWVQGTFTVTNPSSTTLTGQHAFWDISTMDWTDPMPAGSVLMDWADGKDDTWHRAPLKVYYPFGSKPSEWPYPVNLHWKMGPADGWTLKPHASHTYRIRLSMPQSSMAEPIHTLYARTRLGAGSDGQGGPSNQVGSDAAELAVRGMVPKVLGLPATVPVDRRAFGFTLDIRTQHKADWRLKEAGFGLDAGWSDKIPPACDARIEVRDPVFKTWNPVGTSMYLPGKMTALNRWATGPVDHRVVTARLLLGGNFTAGKHQLSAGQYPGIGPNTFFPTANFTATRPAGAKPACLVLDTTAIHGFNATPEPVRKGATITATGVLDRKSGKTTKPVSGQRVSLYFQAKGSTKWSYSGYATTNASGRFTKKLTASKDGTWMPVFSGTTTMRTSRGTADAVDVK
ncbi:hypothetical protein ACFWVC_24785 [Streptomyces sp. NPDC058691]|uniref:hypothetical protein n=1 Tax=Streptomyces sp. NPDC058691 TaxID=3346601 RepID=UPI0036657C75